MVWQSSQGFEVLKSHAILLVLKPSKEIPRLQIRRKPLFDCSQAFDRPEMRGERLDQGRPSTLPAYTQIILAPHNAVDELLQIAPLEHVVTEKHRLHCGEFKYNQNAENQKRRVGTGEVIRTREKYKFQEEELFLFQDISFQNFLFPCTLTPFPCKT